MIRDMFQALFWVGNCIKADLMKTIISCCLEYLYFFMAYGTIACSKLLLCLFLDGLLYYGNKIFMNYIIVHAFTDSTGFKLTQDRQSTDKI